MTHSWQLTDRADLCPNSQGQMPRARLYEGGVSCRSASMRRNRLNAVVQSIAQTCELRTDAELLELFLSRNDQTAFEALVWRHGSMVFNLCRRVLNDVHEAEDAFQATFLVFAKKARSINRQGSVASWLYKVAYRIACRSRAESAKRCLSPLLDNAQDLDELQTGEQIEFATILDEEIQRLPEKFRAPVVLHLLQGRTCRDTARELGWPLGTVATRLGRAKELLRQRLTQRGVVLPAGLAIGVALTTDSFAAPSELVLAAARSALNYAAGVLVGSERALALSDGVLNAMKLKKLFITIGLASIIMVGGALLGLRSEAEPPGPPPGQQLVKPAADDWPTFGGSRSRNMVNLVARKVPIDADETTGKNSKWRAEVGTRAAGGPVVAGGRVYVGTNNGRPRDAAVQFDAGVIMCFDEATGKFIWQAAHARHPAGRIHDWPQHGTDSTPTIENGFVYYMSNRCTLVCARAAGRAGKSDIVWELDLIKDLKVFPHDRCPCSPLVVGDLIFVVTSNGVDEGHTKVPAPDAPSLIALNKRSGKLVWKDNSPGANIMHTQWSSPAYAEIGGK